MKTSYRPHPKDDGRLYFHFVCQSTPGGGGVPGLSKGKNFWQQIWLDTCSDWKKKIFCWGTPPPPPPPPPPVKGKNFDTRFGLIHVQTGKKKFFVEGTPPSPPVKGKIFDTRFGLIHVQTGKKYFCQRTPPPPTDKGKNFWHQIWLDTCSDWKKNFLLRGPPLPPQ